MKKIVQLGLGLIVSWSSISMLSPQSFAHNHHDHAHDEAEGVKLVPPMAFVENRGQWDAQAKYKISIPGGNMFITANGFMYDFLSAEDQVRAHNATDEERKKMVIRGHAYRVSFVNANTSTSFAPSGKRPEYSNYFIGQDSTKWAGNVPHYTTVLQRDLYAGIDMKVYNTDKKIKYDLIVRPSANPNVIAFKFDGVKPSLAKDGSLYIKTSINEVVEEAPYTYQVINGKKVEVPSRYKLENGLVSFEFPKGYNKNYDLIIDPNLVFASYSGGTSTSYYAHSATYDDEGNTYITALATGSSTGWPTTTGAYQVTASGSYAVTLSKLNATGSALVYSTYFAPSTGIAHPNALRVTAANELVMVGTVTSNTLPVTAGAYQTTSGGGNDIFITKFNTTGTALVASTYLGGNGNEGSIVSGTTYSGTIYGYASEAVNPSEVAFDAQGNIWVTSNSASSNYPVTANAFQSTFGGNYDVVLTKLNPTLTSVIYSTFVGGNAWDGGIGMEYNSNTNEIVVTGYTASSNFPTTAGVYQQAFGGGVDGFVFKINNASYAMGPITYLGTNNTDVGMRVAFDCGNNVFIAGVTLGNFPVTNTAAEGLVANGNIFIAKLNPTLSNIVAATRTGAYNATYRKILPQAMMVDNCGNILITSMAENTAQNGMPLTPDAFETNPRSLYFAAFGPNFSSLEFGTYYGSPSPSSEHFHPGVSRMDPRGVVYVVKCTSISTYPTTPGSFAPTKMNGSNLDIISFKFDFEAIGLNATSESGYAGYGSIPHAVRGCKSAYIHYSRNGDTTVPMVLRFNILSGTTPDMAVNGVDYQFVADSLVFNAYERTKSLEIKPLLVPNMPTGSKMVVIESLNPCGCDGAIGEPIRRDTVYIHDSIRADIEEPLPAYCPGTQISITAQVDPGLDYEWSPAEFNNGSLTINPILHTSRTFSIKVTQQGAPPTCPPVIKEFHALVEQFPVIGMSADTTVCILDSISIPVVVSPDSVNYLYNWSPSTGLRANNLQTNFFKMPPGTYNYLVTVTTPLANCTSTHNITINVRPPFKLYNLQPEYGATVDYLSEVNMSAEGAEIYKWSPVELFVDPTLQNPTTLPLKESGYFYVTGIDQYGCKDTAEIFVNVRYPYEPIMPNAFSPNKDGRNDIFRIPNGEYQKIHRFEVYNRWGKRVFSTTDPNIGWDGTDENNGKDCDQGVYGYIITIELPNKEIRTYKGDVTLIR